MNLIDGWHLCGRIQQLKVVTKGGSPTQIVIQVAPSQISFLSHSKESEISTYQTQAWAYKK
jgi:hypothetical protein